MTIKKHSYLDIPKWCKVIHFEGDQLDNVLKHVLLATGVKTWNHDVELDHFVQKVDLNDKYTSINKYRKIILLDATSLKEGQHNKMLEIVNHVEEIGLLSVVRTDSSKESRRCLRKNHVGLSCYRTSDNVYNVRVQYTHNKFGQVDKSYTLSITDNNEVELIYVK